ncbi:MAG: M67 family metallopeptidase [Paludibacteraceae bacterium]|nr:M67 family metallopeptidase [Paludibacteraceae bacterium]
MALTITDETYNSLLNQAREDAPIESCGYLLGPDEETVTQNYRMTNIDHSPEHFSFAPREQFEALNYARRNGLKVVGNWHSHPASPSRPSAEDIKLAYDPNIYYFILSLAENTPVFNAFRIKQGEVTERINLRGNLQ